MGSCYSSSAVNAGNVKVHAAPPSCNSMGPVLMATHYSVGEMVLTMPGQDTMKDEFLQMNPFHAIPTMRDGDFVLAESGAILRYLAVKYAPEAYPQDTKKRAMIDWASDRFATGLYKDFVAVVYPCFGWTEYGSDKAEAAKKCQENLKDFCKFFLKGKDLVGGDTPSIADFRLAPFFYSLEHPIVAKNYPGFECPEDVKRFNRAFLKAVPGAAQMAAEDNPYCIKKWLDGKMQ